MKRSVPNPPALIVARREWQRDPGLEQRGYRKILVSRLYPQEIEAGEVCWTAPVAGQPCPVLVQPGCELAIFDETARQDRHYHKLGTETYLVISGQMGMEVEGREYALDPGDFVTVRPGSLHQVKARTPFTCIVIIANSGGAEDKYLASE